MEIMEEGNLIDRVRILLQRDQTFYKEHQRVLQDKLCSSASGGFLDFPNVTTFVASKITTWWEESYYLLFHSMSSLFKGNSSIDLKVDESDNISLNKSISPKDFVNLISQSSKMVLEHLNTLSQEALDHADLSVLIGTIGAATLIRNAIWIYHQQLIKTNSSVTLSEELKMYQSMSDELAERLLDLHCRLISLYVLQDVDSLNWLAEHQFFEGERSSYTIQMWWFYVQGIREDLWNAMSPKIATRIFSGVINESMTILTSRYMQVQSSKARSDLVVADLSNILLCMFKLLPSICENADELFGCKVESNVIRDIHAKCHLLLCYFLIRAAPLTILYKNFKNGLETAPCTLKKQSGCVEPWIVFVSSVNNENIPPDLTTCSSLPANKAVKHEMLVLISQEQPEWTLFLKVLRMNDCWLLYELLHHVIVDVEEIEENEAEEPCKNFLCIHDCVLNNSIQASILHVLLAIGNRNDIENSLIKVLEKIPQKWVFYFNYSQIWNQNRPLWIRALIEHLRPTVLYIMKIIEYSPDQTASNDKLIRRYIECMKQMTNCLPDGILLLSSFIEDNLPPDILPLEESALIQLMAMCLYDELGSSSRISEALCRLENNKIETSQKKFEESTARTAPSLSYLHSAETDEILIHHLFVENAGRKSLKVLHTYLRQSTAEWLHKKLGIDTKTITDSNNLLMNMFFIGDRAYDQVLSGAWTPKWTSLLNLRLGLTVERLQNLIPLRPEFSSNCELFKHDQRIVKHIKSLLSEQKN